LDGLTNPDNAGLWIELRVAKSLALGIVGYLDSLLMRFRLRDGRRVGVVDHHHEETSIDCILVEDDGILLILTTVGRDRENELLTLRVFVESEQFMSVGRHDWNTRLDHCSHGRIEAELDARSIGTKCLTNHRRLIGVARTGIEL